MAFKLSERDVISALTGVQPDGEVDKRLEKNLFLTQRSICSSSSTTDSTCPTDDTLTTETQGTMHYMSPVSMSSRSDASEYRMDICGYRYESPSFMKLLHTYGKEAEGTISSSICTCVEEEIERTMAIVKPEYVKYQDVVLRAIDEAGLFILFKRFVHLTPEQVSEFYCQHYGCPAFPHMVCNMSCGPVLCLCLIGPNAIEKWKKMVGVCHVIDSTWFFPMSMRVRFGLCHNLPDALHASENLTEACKENRYIYPEGIIEPLMTEEEQIVDYCSLYVNSTLTKGLAEVCRAKPADPICYLAEWLLKNNPYQPQFPNSLALIPT